ncbi:hypothetical protein GDO86_003176 [Hymenochirus boettgeri]|uniref:Uncharacterized protein n=1 Tax=Hymenochirus boettgeri TaxID=247094 RepID=A0A8T2JZW9_9PIPI|nr:hypothetical protein GDO86_003176 [Hymenochirus boettgeri]
MWPLTRRTSDENKVTTMQIAHRKSAGRTPLQDLTAQSLTLSDKKILVNPKLTSNKSTSLAVNTQKSKENNISNTGTPINIWIDHNTQFPFTDSSLNASCSKKNLRPVSLFTTKFTALSPNVSVSELENCTSSNLQNNLQDLKPACLGNMPCSLACDQERLHLNGCDKDFSTAVLESQTAEILYNKFESRKEEQEILELNTDPCSHDLVEECFLLKPCTDKAQESPYVPVIDKQSLGCPIKNEEESTNMDVFEEELGLCKILNRLSFKSSVEASKQGFNKCVSLESPLVPNVNLVIGKIEPDSVEKLPHFLPCIDNTHQESGSIEAEDFLKCETDLGHSFTNSLPSISAQSSNDVLQAGIDIVSQKLAGNNCSKDTLVSELVPNHTFDSDSLEMKTNIRDHTLHEPDSCACIEDYDTLSCVLLTEGADCVLQKNDDKSLNDVKTPVSAKLERAVEIPNKSCNAESNIFENTCSDPPASLIVQSELINTHMRPTSITLTQEFKKDSAANLDYPLEAYLSQRRAFDFPSLWKAKLTSFTPGMQSSLVEVRACSTPATTSSTSTWTTPIMLLNKSMNTSWDIGRKNASPRDNASETDSLLWNFSKESLNNASREELLGHLERTFIVIEVLSCQLQGWQQKVEGSRPSEQRESATQTCITYTSTDEQYYHDLYVRTMDRLKTMQRCNEEEEKIQQLIKESADALKSHKAQSLLCIEIADKMYEITREAKAGVKQKVCQARSLIAEQMNLLKRMNEKMQANKLQRDEMKMCMNEAISARDAAEQCLKYLEMHSAKVISQLQRGLESEKILCKAVEKAYLELVSLKDEWADFAHKAHSASWEIKNDRAQLQLQCSQARELMSQHWHLCGIMKAKTEAAMQEYESMKNEREMAYLEKRKIDDQLEDVKSQNDQLRTETTLLGSELSSLMEHLCKLESENEQLKQEHSDQIEELYAKDSSIKLLEKELDEAITREREIKERNQQLSTEIVPRLDQDLSETLKQKEDLQIKVQDLLKQHASQVACFKDNIEFLEQENHVLFEQVTETEKQLKNNLFALRERNLQCETQKDTINKLQNELSKLEEELLSTKSTAKDMLLKMGKEISDSSIKVSSIMENLLDQKEQMRDLMQREVHESLQMLQTPARKLELPPSGSVIKSGLKPQCEETRTGSAARNVKSIWSETSAFTIVQPFTSATTDGKQESLPDLLYELSDIVSDFATSSSYIIETKQKEIKNLQLEMSDLKDKLQTITFRSNADRGDFMEEIGIWQRKNKNLEDSVTSKQQYIRELEEIVHQQEQRILEQVSKEKNREDLLQENTALKRSLELCESEAGVLKAELTKNQSEAARDWVQEKLLLHKDLTKLRLMLVDTENSKSEIVNRAIRHRDIFERNLARSESEVKKLDDIIERIRKTLLSIPEVVANCEELKQVLDYIN